MIVKRPTTFLLFLNRFEWNMIEELIHKNLDQIKQTWISESLCSGKNVNFIYFADKGQDSWPLNEFVVPQSWYNVNFPILGPDVWYSHQGNVLFFVWTIRKWSCWTEVSPYFITQDRNEFLRRIIWKSLTYITHHLLFCLFHYYCVGDKSRYVSWVTWNICIVFSWNSSVVRKRFIK